MCTSLGFTLITFPIAKTDSLGFNDSFSTIIILSISFNDLKTSYHELIFTFGALTPSNSLFCLFISTQTSSLNSIFVRSDIFLI